MKVAILAVTSGGRALAEKLAGDLPGACLVDGKDKVARSFASLWREVDGFVCIMAAGIVMRAAAPLMTDKAHDPCMVVLDEKGRYAVSLLSGHLGGGNELARQLAALTGGDAVITTASDTLELPALDLWAGEQQLVPESRESLTRVSARLVNKGEIKIFSEPRVTSLPRGFKKVDKMNRADIVISNRLNLSGDFTVFRPRNLVVGIGCNRGTPAHEFEEALTELFEEANLSLLGIRNLASIDLKRDEAGLLDFAARHDWRLDFYDREALNEIKKVPVSKAALQAVGAIGVAEPASLLSARDNEQSGPVLVDKLIVRKKKWRNVTMAVAKADFTLSEPVRVRPNT